MLSLKKTSTGLALSAGLLLTACAGDGEINIDEGSQQFRDTEPVAELEDLVGVSTAVAIAPSFLEGLQSLEVTPGLVGSATLDNGTLSFPITGGEVTYYDPGSGREPFVEGEIEHEGSGLSLSAGGTTVELTDFVVDPGASVLTGTVSAGGEVVAEEVELFFLDGRTLEPLRVDEEAGTAELEGTTVSLTAEAADLLNETFGTSALAEFFLVGRATITLDLDGVAEDEVETGSPSPTASPTGTTPGATTAPTTGGTATTPTASPAATAPGTAATASPTG